MQEATALAWPAPEAHAAYEAKLNRLARWSIVVCLWLLTLATFSAVGRTPEAGESFDSIALLKLFARATTLGVSTLVIVTFWHRERTHDVLRQLFPFFVFLAWCVLSVAWSPMKGFSLSQASSLISLVLLSAAIGCCWRGSRDTSLYLGHVSAAMLVYATVVVVVALVDFNASGLNHRGGERGLVHPTAAGATSSLGLLIVVASRLLWGWKWTRVLLAPAVIVHCALLLLSSSRAAVLLTASLGLGAWLMFNSRSVLGSILLAIAAGGLLYLAIDPGIELIEDTSRAVTAYLQRGQSAEEIAAVSGRTELWELVWDSFLESPVIGHGYFMCSSSGLLNVWGDTTRETAHNLLLQVFVSTGLVGGALFLGAMARVGSSLRAKLYGAPPLQRVALLALLLACWYAGWGVGCESFMGSVQPEAVVFFLVMGIILASNVPIVERVGDKSETWR